MRAINVPTTNVVSVEFQSRYSVLAHIDGIGNQEGLLIWAVVVGQGRVCQVNPPCFMQVIKVFIAIYLLE
ncbi:hypothetical protein D3C84_1205400 [compost metagenome]